MKKINLSTKPYILRETSKSTVSIEFIFPHTYDKDKDMYRSRLMSSIMSRSNEKYRELDEYANAKKKNMIMDISCFKETFNTNNYIIFELTVPKENLIESYNIEEAFEFFLDTIYKPCIDGKAFYKKIFEQEKIELLEGLKSGMKNIYYETNREFYKAYDETGNLINDIYENIDKLEKITSEDVYEYYLENILNNKPVILVNGNITKQRVFELLKKYNLYSEENIEINTDYIKKYIIKEKTLYLEKDIKYSQSVLCYGYKIKDYEEEDADNLSLLKRIINGSEVNMLLNAFRIDNQVIYHYDFSTYVYEGLIELELYLDYNNKEKVEEILASEIHKLKDKEFLKYSISKILKGMEYDLVYQLDSKNVKMNNFLVKKIGMLPSLLEERKRKVESFDADEFIKFLERIELDTVYFFRGIGNE